MYFLSEFPIGFKQDLDDLKSLVEYAVQKHSKQIRFNKKLPKEPPALQAFYNLYTEMKKLKDDLEAMRYTYLFLNQYLNDVLTLRLSPHY